MPQRSNGISLPVKSRYHLFVSLFLCFQRDFAAENGLETVLVAVFRGNGVLHS
jgi:hypothetical protein